jgi:hypothetical protein
MSRTRNWLISTGIGVASAIALGGTAYAGTPVATTQPANHNAWVTHHHHSGNCPPLTERDPEHKGYCTDESFIPEMGGHHHHDDD